VRKSASINNNESACNELGTYQITHGVDHVAARAEALQRRLCD
jgi:hypothetical protein